MPPPMLNAPVAWCRVRNLATFSSCTTSESKEVVTLFAQTLSQGPTRHVAVRGHGRRPLSCQVLQRVNVRNQTTACVRVSDSEWVFAGQSVSQLTPWRLASHHHFITLASAANTHPLVYMSASASTYGTFLPPIVHFSIVKCLLTLTLS